MRRMRLTLALLAVIIVGFAASSTTVLGQAGILINLTNQVWKYDESNTDYYSPVPPFFDPLFDDSAWLDGRGVFAFENNANVNPYTNTVLSIGTTVTYYFRTHFSFTGNPDDYVLIASNLIDDGYVFYLNGVEVRNYNMTAPPYTHGSVATAANPGGEGVYITRQLLIPSGTLLNGDNVLAVSAHQNAIGSSDIVFGMWLHSSLAYRPRILSPTAPSTVTVEQGRNHTLRVDVDASPAATFQWFFNDVAIPGATGSSYTLTNMDSSMAGAYFATASNSQGTSNSPPVTVNYDIDDTNPVFVHASGNPANLNEITLFFSENIQGNVGEQFSYAVENMADPNDTLGGVATAGYGASSNMVVLTTVDQRAPGATYRVILSFHGFTDVFGNPMDDPAVRRVGGAITFQEGANGYTGTLDTEVRANLPDSAAGGTLTTVNTDTADPNMVHSLLRFDNVTGGQISPGAVIVSATLRIYTDNQTVAGTPIRMLRMHAAWDETSTWNSLGNGIDQTNGVVEGGVTDAIINGSEVATFDTMDVTAAVQSWADGAPNYGWAFLPSGDDGWRWATSEFGTAGNRPLLTVDFYVPDAPCNIVDQPDSVTVPEKSPFTLTVGASGSDLRYQWFFDPTGPAPEAAIPGATAFTYTVPRAIPANSGNYRVAIENDFPSSCNSATATVTVTPDTTPPSLTSALGNPNQTTITLVFNDTMDPASAGTAGNYTLDGGLTVSSAVVNGNTVTLTTDAPRVIGNNYTLNISGNVSDDAVALNPIAPVSMTLPQRFVVMPFDQVWKYETNGTDQGTAWKEASFDDSAWPSGTALLGWEPSATLTTLAALGLNTNNGTLWPLMAAGPAQIITYYVRSSVNIPYDLSGATVTLRQVIDDGSVYYFNGTERFRFDMPTGDITYLTEAVNATGEGVIRNQNLTNITCGANTIAVSIHNDSPTSTDILFAASLEVTVPSFAACPSGQTLSIVNNGNGTVTLSWAPPGGTLQESTDLTNWTPSARTNGETFTPTGLRFYRVQ